jgi:hypothetical protein
VPEVRLTSQGRETSEEYRPLEERVERLREESAGTLDGFEAATTTGNRSLFAP